MTHRKIFSIARYNFAILIIFLFFTKLIISSLLTIETYVMVNNKTNNNNNTIQIKPTKTIITPTDVKTEDNTETTYNKRQFWPYERLYAKKQRDHSRFSERRLLENPRNKKTKKNKVFHVINKKVITDKTLNKRLDGIYIPPAYTNVVVAKSANNKIQAIGTDTRGRRQYIYNTQFTKKRNARKYEDIMELAKKIGSIERDNDTAIAKLLSIDARDWHLPNDYIPIIVYMLRTYHFRIGNERYVNDNHSYGITTLRAEHITFDKGSNGGNKFTIKFIGKKGILNQFTDTNAKIAKLLRILIENSKKPGHDGFLFKYKGSGQTGNGTQGEMYFITPDQIQAFFEEKYNSYITPKMFRTWYGNYHMLVCLREMFNKGEIKHRLTKMEKNEIVKKCSEHVSSKLNNTPTVSKQSYIDNKILELVMHNPYRLASSIPDSSDGQHAFLYKIIKKLRT
jgi:DNA topoisomerase-1